MRDLVLHLARGLVDEPGRVAVYEHAEEGHRLIELSVAPGDRGRVIGRQGRTANALRTLLGALAERKGETCSLEILD